MRSAQRSTWWIGAVASWCAAASASAAVVTAELIAAAGQVPLGAGGVAIASLSAPVTNGNGDVGFLGALVDDTRFIWFDTGISFLDTDVLPLPLSGGEAAIGISDAGNFVYSPQIGLDDAIWTDAGWLIDEGVAAPGKPGAFITFTSRPSMLPDGTIHFVAGLTTVPGSAATLYRALYRRPPGGTITPLLVGFDSVIDGFTLQGGPAVTFDYHLSDNGQHHVHVLDMVMGTTADFFVYVDGELLLREGDDAGDGTAWENFDAVSINNCGDWIVGGDTTGDAASDEFIAFNGQIVVREGDRLNGFTLPSGTTLRAASINNRGQVAHMWGVSTDEQLFVGDGATLGSSSVLVLQTGDEVDLDGDGSSEAVVTDFEASLVVAPGLSLAEDGRVFIEVELTDIGSTSGYEAIVALAIPEPAPTPDLDGDCAVDGFDLATLLGAWGPCPRDLSCPAELDGNGIVNGLDLAILLAAWS